MYLFCLALLNFIVPFQLDLVNLLCIVIFQLIYHLLVKKLPRTLNEHFHDKSSGSQQYSKVLACFDHSPQL